MTAYLQRATAAGLSWPLPADLDDGALEARLFQRAVLVPDRAVPVWAEVHQELKRPGVTLALLWQEYRAVHPAGYAYSQYCARYRHWRRAVQPSMRQVIARARGSSSTSRAGGHTGSTRRAASRSRRSSSWACSAPAA